LTLIPQNRGTHANIVVYDKVRNEAIRFEPYGPMEIMDDAKLNRHLYILFKKILDPMVKYFEPKDYLTENRFQVVSSENDIVNKKLGDPAGYCLAWVYWFLELRLSNPDENIKTLITDTFNNIVDTQSEDNTNQVLNHIRNYSSKLDSEKNNFLKKIGFKDEEIYNMYYNDDSIDIIIKGLSDELKKIISDRTDRIKN
jgi:hypothetical protein